MNAIAVTENRRRAGLHSALLTYLIAGAGILSSVPVLAAGVIYDASINELKITAVKAIQCTNNLNETLVHLDATGKVLDTSAGTVDVTCTGAGKVGLAIAKNNAGPYTEKADGTPVSPAAGTLTILVGGGGTVTTLASADNHTSQNITKMVVATAVSSKATFTLTPSGTVTTPGDFTYSLASAAWVE
ncbi:MULTISPECIES: hypothetical protein [Serratia]|uniref:hypothetical protein n=1 Tax=Serratia TaxID=613 RepID=UPI0021789E30|nr:MULTISPECIES: hypothetical protein [Serratia]CAI1001150.1 Uncharacterised protein [Serratia quinivorans]CAI1086892.1 Uncharacterised protein [Serratia quinivorans]CAI2122244.1 Uncharacterised protein [Serratia quinivorans]CAI2489316.1 Uncharacterised protein [Serratia liquefaciens]